MHRGVGGAWRVGLAWGGCYCGLWRFRRARHTCASGRFSAGWCLLAAGRFYTRGNTGAPGRFDAGGFAAWRAYAFHGL